MLAVDEDSDPQAGEVDLSQILRVVTRRHRLVEYSVLGLLLLALIYLHLATYKYTAALIVSPVTSSSGGVAQKLGGLSSLASFAGVNVSNLDNGLQSFQLYQRGVYSRDAAIQLSRDPEIMHQVFHEQWDARDNKWRQPLAVIEVAKSFFKIILGMPLRIWTPPDAAVLQNYIVEHVGIDTDPKSPALTITYDDRDPVFAVTFLHALDRAVDNKVRINDLVRANQYVNYLSDKLNHVENVDVRQSLLITLADQERTLMMANSPAPYAAQPFGPPSASEKPTQPKIFLVLAASLFAGLLLGVAAAVWLPEPFDPRQLFGRARGRDRQATFP